MKTASEEYRERKENIINWKSDGEPKWSAPSHIEFLERYYTFLRKAIDVIDSGENELSDKSKLALLGFASGVASTIVDSNIPLPIQDTTFGFLRKLKSEVFKVLPENFHRTAAFLARDYLLFIGPNSISEDRVIEVIPTHSIALAIIHSMYSEHTCAPSEKEDTERKNINFPQLNGQLSPAISLVKKLLGTSAIQSQQVEFSRRGIEYTPIFTESSHFASPFKPGYTIDFLRSTPAGASLLQWQQGSDTATSSWQSRVEQADPLPFPLSQKAECHRRAVSPPPRQRYRG